MVSITPDRMPYMRRETLEWMRECGTAFYKEQYRLSNSAATAAIGNSLSPDNLVSLECERLTRGGMYYVDKDMCRLIEHAAPTMPEFAPSPFDLPSPFGFLWWDGKVIQRPYADIATLTYIFERIHTFEDIQKTTLRPVINLITTLITEYGMTRNEAIRECASIAKQIGQTPGNRIQTRCSMSDLKASGSTEMLSYIGGEPSPIRAVTWGPYGVDQDSQSLPGVQRVDGTVAAAVWVSFWTQPAHTDRFWPSFKNRPTILVENEVLYPWYMNSEDNNVLVSKDIGNVFSWFHALLATFVLSKQENLADTERRMVDRAERKRTARQISILAPDSILITRLRQSHKGSGTKSGERTIGKDHRFMVDGHWRKVWCGSHADPQRPRVQRPQWILPYVKGADGAPLVLRDRVVKL